MRRVGAGRRDGAIKRCPIKNSLAGKSELILTCQSQHEETNYIHMHVNFGCDSDVAYDFFSL